MERKEYRELHALKHSLLTDMTQGPLHTYNIPLPPPPKLNIIGPEPNRWCKFHKLKGHYTENYYHLNKEIEHPIQKSDLKKYV